MNLNNFFNPKSVAVVGASSDKNKVGYALTANLLSGAKRDIYPVSISENEILGLKVYKSLKDIENNIDLVLIAVRADIVPAILEECAAKKVPSVVIIAAGFKEMGPDGALLEKKVADIAKNHGISLLGPNCLGTIDTHSDINASFAARKPTKGHTSFISQSGALGTAVLDKALAEGVGFSKFVSLGNEAALTEIDFLEYLKDDDKTKAILMYVEQLANGPEFMRLASEITKKKPIVLIKAGRSARGQQAVISHTGSLAPEDAVFTAACKQSGIIVVDSIREFFNMAKLFELGITRPLSNLIILTNAGGPAVVTADLIDLSHSLSLSVLSDRTKTRLKEVLPPMAALNNPVDIIGDALSGRYEAALKILVEEDSADAIIVLLTPQMMTEAEATAKLIAEYSKKKPVIPVFLGGPSIESGLLELRKQGLINFSFPKDAIEALANIARNAAKNVTEDAKRTKPLSPDTVQPTLRMMPFLEMRDLLHKYGLILPGVLIIKDRCDIPCALKQLGKRPFILKAMSPDIVHKSDVGAIKLSLETEKDVEDAWDEIMANLETNSPKAKIEGMLLQTMIPPEKEVIIGMKRDPIFGPTVLFGLGGIFAEALKDTALRIAPVSKEAALEMIHDIRGIKILTGLRGEKPSDLPKVADIIVTISKMAIEHPEIKEIDLNPVMVRYDKAELVDVRVMI